MAIEISTTTKEKIKTEEEFFEKARDMGACFLFPSGSEFDLTQNLEKAVKKQLEKYFEISPVVKEKIIKTLKQLRGRIARENRGMIKLFILSLLLRKKEGMTAREIKEKIEEFFLFARKNRVQRRGVYRHLEDLKRMGLIKYDGRKKKFFIDAEKLDESFVKRVERNIKPWKSFALAHFYRTYFLLSLPSGLYKKIVRDIGKRNLQFLEPGEKKYLEELFEQACLWFFLGYRQLLNYEGIIVFSEKEIDWRGEEYIKLSLKNLFFGLYLFEVLKKNKNLPRSIRYKIDAFLLYLPRPFSSPMCWEKLGKKITKILENWSDPTISKSTAKKLWKYFSEMKKEIVHPVFPAFSTFLEYEKR